MNYKQKIQITGKNIDDIFRLPCVQAVRKDVFGQVTFDLYSFVMEEGLAYASIGDWLCEKENGKWVVERGKED